jgi:hypothetical protein
MEGLMSRSGVENEDQRIARAKQELVTLDACVHRDDGQKECFEG